MSISAKSVRFDRFNMWVSLSDARTIGVPLAWFPKLLHATPAQRDDFEISATTSKSARGGFTGMRWTKIFPSMA